jgi:hypothetical protein
MEKVGFNSRFVVKVSGSLGTDCCRSGVAGDGSVLRG